MELFSKIPGDDSVVERIQTLDESRFGYPDFADFHLAQFVAANIECVEDLSQLANQIYLLIWLSCKVDRNGDERSTFNLVERYAHLMKSSVMHIKLAQFLDEVAETLTEVIPSDQRERELNIFAFFLTNKSEDERPYIPIMNDFRAANKCCSWLQDKYVGAIMYVSAIGPLRVYFKTSDRLFKKIVRGFQETKELSADQWTVMITHVASILPDSVDIGQWEPMQIFKASVYQPTKLDNRVIFTQLCTLFRSDWKKVWTLMGWTTNRKTVRQLHEFRSRSRVRPKHNTSSQLLLSV